MLLSCSFCSTPAEEHCTRQLESVALTLESVVLALESVVLASLSFPVWRFARGSRPTHAGEPCCALGLCLWLLRFAFVVRLALTPAPTVRLRRFCAVLVPSLFGPLGLVCSFACSGFLDHWPLLHARLLIPLRILIPRRISNLRL